MGDRLENKIEKLGLSRAACEELRKCNIDTVQDLMLLINEKLVSKKENRGRSYNIGMKDAVMSVLKGRPNEILNCEEIRDELINKYGDGVSNNIGSIRSVALMLMYNGVIERASSGQYFYPLNNVAKREKVKHSSVQDTHYISLKDATSEILKSINGPFNCKIIQEKLRRKYGNKVSTKKGSIKSRLNELLRSGVIMRAETGDYIYRFDHESRKPINISNLDSFLRSHKGKEIEFRYKTELSHSDKRWRRETVWLFDDKYLYVTKRYLSGRPIMYLKERIVEYREP